MKTGWPTRSALLHMRWAFSLFLMPVFLFAASQVHHASSLNLLLVFICWHALAYPASNGYNSYFDRDEGSIALLKHPPKTDISLYYFSLFLEVLAILLALFVGPLFALNIAVYGLLSKAYSHPRVRLKKYPWISFFVVFLFQGAFVFWASFLALLPEAAFRYGSRFFEAAFSCSFLIGASYPLTQIYQHDEDRRRGDITLSIRLGKTGTLIFSAFLFMVGFALLTDYIFHTEKGFFFLFPGLLLMPAVLHFGFWFYRIRNNKGTAGFREAMRQSLLGAAGLLIFFSLLFAKNWF
ncbi:MAG: UbiA prenyltransferase family protein [Mucilaginibacter polytrichastri]|nr:UbiA prenyltransferase family protein [Mucilaginibacter polytrichastri]